MKTLLFKKYHNYFYLNSKHLSVVKHFYLPKNLKIFFLHFISLHFKRLINFFKFHLLLFDNKTVLNHKTANPGKKLTGNTATDTFAQRNI